MKFYVPPQLTRLAIAFGIFITLFILVRNLLVPETFGEFGHYRGASLIDNALPEIHYAGEKACFDCHQDIEDLKKGDVHNGIRCETCHGPGQKHVLSADAADILKPTGRDFCGNCHGKNAAKRVSAVFQVDLNKHNEGKNCLECHNPHQPWKTLK
jgi:hypothetical protein